MELKEKLEKLAETSKTKIDQTTSEKAVEELRIQLLGKKGQLTELLKMMKDLDKKERPVIGKLANEIRDDLSTRITDKKESLAQLALEEKLREESIDVTSYLGENLKEAKPILFTKLWKRWKISFRHGI